MQYRVSGPDVQKVRDYSRQLGDIVAKNPHLGLVTFDWGEPARKVKVNVLHDKARLLGVSSQDISTTLNSVVHGATVTQVRDDIYPIDVIARAREDERATIATLQNLQLPAANGRSAPLAAVASFSYGLEQPVIWRRARPFAGCVALIGQHNVGHMASATPARASVTIRLPSARSTSRRSSRELNTKQDKLTRLYRAIEDGVIDLDEEIRDRVKALKTERDIAQASLDRIASQNTSSTAITPERIEAFADLIREKIDSADVQGRKSYLRSVISYVEVDDDKVRIVGDKASLAAVIAGRQTQADNVRGFVRKWRARKDSNPWPLPSESR